MILSNHNADVFFSILSTEIQQASNEDGMPPQVLNPHTHKMFQ